MGNVPVKRMHISRPTEHNVPPATVVRCAVFVGSLASPGPGHGAQALAAAMRKEPPGLR